MGKVYTIREYVTEKELGYLNMDRLSERIMRIHGTWDIGSDEKFNCSFWIPKKLTFKKNGQLLIFKGGEGE